MNEPESIAVQLWRKRAWLAPGVVLAFVVALVASYDVHFFPPKLERNSVEFASATTQVLIDSPQPSSLLDVDQNLNPLAERANVYARLMTTPVLIARTAAAARVSRDQIEAKGPYNVDQPRIQREPTSERRSVQLGSERDMYRMRFDAEEGLPLVTIYAQAPKVDVAERLANGGAKALQGYVDSVQRRQGIADRERLVVTQLGRAHGAVVNPGVDRQITLLAFIGVLVGWWLLLQLIAAVRRFLQARVPPDAVGPVTAPLPRERLSEPRLPALPAGRPRP